MSLPFTNLNKTNEDEWSYHFSISSIQTPPQLTKEFSNKCYDEFKKYMDVCVYSLYKWFRLPKLSNKQNHFYIN